MFRDTAFASEPLGLALKAPVLLTASESSTAIKVAKNYAAAHGIRSGYVLGGVKNISDEDVRTILGLADDVEIVTR